MTSFNPEMNPQHHKLPPHLENVKKEPQFPKPRVSLEEFHWNLNLLLVHNRFPMGLYLDEISNVYYKFSGVFLTPDDILPGSSGWKQVFEKTILSKVFPLKKIATNITNSPFLNDDNCYSIMPEANQGAEEMSQIWALGNYRALHNISAESSSSGVSTNQVRTEHNYAEVSRKRPHSPASTDSDSSSDDDSSSTDTSEASSNQRKQAQFKAPWTAPVSTKSTQTIPQKPTKKVMGDLKLTCVACKELEDDQHPIISCDNCDKWYHLTCAALESHVTYWLCPQCKRDEDFLVFNYFD